MPADSSSVSKVYQDQLTTLSHGLALWYPNPPKEIYDKVAIGDVGYLYDGSFIRMFNVMLPWSHDSNRALGEPEPYQSLDCGPFANTLKRQFDRVKHCSCYVSAETNAGNLQAVTPDDVEGITYKFRKRGALLSLPNGGYHEDVIRAQVFEDYIQHHVGSWVTSWAAAAFVDDTMDAEISLASRTLNNGGASFVWSNIRGRVLYHNSRLEPFHEEQNSTITQDQCVFIRGFRVKDDKMQVIRVSCVPVDDDSNIGVVDAIRPPIKNEHPQRSPYRRPTFQRLGNDGGSGSSLDTIRPPINPRLFPYPSSTALQSNGSLYNASFMTSPIFDSLVEVLNDKVERIRHEDPFAEDTTSITRDNAGLGMPSSPGVQSPRQPPPPPPPPPPHSHSTEALFPAADAPIGADVFHMAARNPDFVRRAIEEGDSPGVQSPRQPPPPPSPPPPRSDSTEARFSAYDTIDTWALLADASRTMQRELQRKPGFLRRTIERLDSP